MIFVCENETHSSLSSMFMQLEPDAKIRYAERARSLPKKYGGANMTHILLHLHPQILLLDDSWVDMLLDIEIHENGKHGMSSLIYLLDSL